MKHDHITIGKIKDKNDKSNLESQKLNQQLKYLDQIFQYDIKDMMIELNDKSLEKLKELDKNLFNPSLKKILIWELA